MHHCCLDQAKRQHCRLWMIQNFEEIWTRDGSTWGSNSSMQTSGRPGPFNHTLSLTLMITLQVQLANLDGLALATENYWGRGCPMGRYHAIYSIKTQSARRMTKHFAKGIIPSFTSVLTSNLIGSALEHFTFIYVGDQNASQNTSSSPTATDSHCRMSLGDFSPELLAKIFLNLSYKSLLSVMAVSVKWNAIV
ncbi:hypothetical protein FB451DRAFT_1179680 [Mycena latifolia]|nr:hypothetical protein FB451DRAFT_1179680 [Mycena latifolia]